MYNSSEDETFSELEPLDRGGGIGTAGDGRSNGGNVVIELVPDLDSVPDNTRFAPSSHFGWLSRIFSPAKPTEAWNSMIEQYGSQEFDLSQQSSSCIVERGWIQIIEGLVNGLALFLFSLGHFDDARKLVKESSYVGLGNIESVDNSTPNRHPFLQNQNPLQ
ncbi:hypothetical protein F2Q68_00016734 [Brassica cretica]|uniref:Uncharacterized protein n=1 Tax=Brassica cretica TaxID=69181 RepID=A0A8S9HGB2_BRACR|nr:hypothetical protein F2Q68_00016734 [Brassica cretica]